MAETITVYGSNGIMLLLYSDVAKALGHTPWKHLDEAETWEAIGANARHGIRTIEAKLAGMDGGAIGGREG